MPSGLMVLIPGIRGAVTSCIMRISAVYSARVIVCMSLAPRHPRVVHAKSLEQQVCTLPSSAEGTNVIAAQCWGAASAGDTAVWPDLYPGADGPFGRHP